MTLDDAPFSPACSTSPDFLLNGDSRCAATSARAPAAARAWPRRNCRLGRVVPLRTYPRLKDLNLPREQFDRELADVAGSENSDHLISGNSGHQPVALPGQKTDAERKFGA